MLFENDKPKGSRHLGYVTIRIPITEVTESESWEIPEQYTYLDVEKSELVSHDIPESYQESLLASSDQMFEYDINLGGWAKDEISATYNPASPSD